MSSRVNIVAFSGRAGAGKDTAANMLGYDHHLYFAKALKDWGLSSLKFIMNEVGLDTFDDRGIQKSIFGTQKEKEAPLPPVSHFGIQTICQAFGIITLGASIFAERNTAAILIGAFGGFVTWLQTVSFSIQDKKKLATKIMVALHRIDNDIVSQCVDDSILDANLYKLLRSIRVEHYPLKGSGMAFAAVACSVLGVIWTLFGSGIWMASVPYVVALNYFAQLEDRFVTICMNDGTRQLLTGRRLLQMIGTEVVRKATKEGAPKLWPAIVEKKCEELIKRNPNAKIVVTDCRFPDEVEMLKKFSTRFVHVYREENPTTKMSHASEAAIDDLYRDVTVNNKGTLEELYDVMNNMETDFSWKK